MPSRSDHIRLDAEHAARLEIAKVLQRYSRRIYEEARAHIATDLAAADPGTILDGTEIGEEAVKRAIVGYLGAAEASSAIEAGATSSD